MAFTVPGTYTVGEQPPASKLNTIVTAITELQAAVADSGWVNMTINTGFTGTSAATRRIGDVVYMRGTIKQNSGAYPSGGAAPGTIGAAAHYPARTVRIITPGNASSTPNFLTALFAASGAVTVYGNGTTPPDTIYLDGVTYMAT